MTTQVPNGVLAFDGGALSGFRNRIINGDMRVAQRGTSGLAPGFTLDRWFVNNSGTAINVSQFLGGTTFAQAVNALQVNGVAGNSGVSLWQRIESVNSRDLAGQTVTVSYWVYQTTGSSMTVTTNFMYANAIDNFSAQTNIGTPAGTVVPTATWTKVTCNQAIPAAATTGLQVLLCANTPAIVAAQNLYITGVQLELGSVATPFETRPIGTELALCQRYYYDSRTAVQAPSYVAYASSASTAWTNASFPVPMRVTPTITLLSYASTAGKISVIGSAVDVGTSVAATPAQIGKDRFIQIADSGSGLTATLNYWFAATASAEL